jgi:hypothetical protein
MRAMPVSPSSHFSLTLHNWPGASSGEWNYGTHLAAQGWGDCRSRIMLNRFADRGNLCAQRNALDPAGTNRRGP